MVTDPDMAIVLPGTTIDRIGRPAEGMSIIGTAIGRTSIAVGITAAGTGTGATAALTGMPTPGAPGVRRRPRSD
jgi:hypothetical protein